MHDTAYLEGQGVPAVFVASGEFEDAAEVQAQALGVVPGAIFVAHPIQDRTDGELEALADGAVEAVVRALTT